MRAEGPKKEWKGMLISLELGIRQAVERDDLVAAGRMATATIQLAGCSFNCAHKSGRYPKIS
jgi:hypothetical protein